MARGLFGVWTSDDFSLSRFQGKLSIKMWSRLTNFHWQHCTQNYHLQFCPHDVQGDEFNWQHYDDVIMDSISSQITSLTIVYPTFHSGADQIKHQSSASLAFVWEIHRWAVNFPHKWPVARKMFPFDDVIMAKKGLIPTQDKFLCCFYSLNTCIGAYEFGKLFVQMCLQATIKIFLCYLILS